MELTIDCKSPRLQLGIFSLTANSRDSALDNLIITHEYGNGITSRLTCGAATVDCSDFLDEQHSEGWSD